MPRAAVTANSALASLGRYWRDSRPRHCSRADIPAWRPQKSHYCIIGSDNGLSPGRRQAIIWTNARILVIRTLGTNFSEILSKIHTFSFKKMCLKMSSGKWRSFCLGLNVFIYYLEPSNYLGRAFGWWWYHNKHHGTCPHKQSIILWIWRWHLYFGSRPCFSLWWSVKQ